MAVAAIERIGPYMQAAEGERSPSGLTRRWSIHSGNVPDGHVGDPIAVVSWYAPWRRYAVAPGPGVILDAECMRTLADFCDHKTREQRAETRARAR